MANFTYGPAETGHLSRRDRRLGALIERLGPIERALEPDPFVGLVCQVVGQQISNKAMHTVWARLCERMGGVTPERLAAADPAEIQSCGLSMRKAGYIKGIAEAAARGDVDFNALADLPDEDVIAQLSALRGVGVWTAEMLLLFSLGRPDVLSWGDLAIRRGMMRLYAMKTLTRERFERMRKRYAPHGSVASLYLWALAGLEDDERSQPGPKAGRPDRNHQR